MKREDALKLSEKAIAELASDIEAGRSESLNDYLAMLGRFHRYSFGNVMMICLQKPDASHVAGFSTWKRLGRHVKKGEKGIAILAPLVSRKASDDYDEEKKDRRVFGFRVVHVFDVSQTEGRPLAELAQITGDPGARLEAIKHLISDEGIKLTVETIPGGALGMSAGGSITVVPGLEAAEEFSVLAHELGHELLHRDERRKETTQTVRETEAEAVAYVVCQAVGLDCSTRSSDYIQLYNGDTETLAKSLEHIQRASTRILSALEAIPAEPEQEAA